MGKKAHIKKTRTCLVCKQTLVLTSAELRAHAERCAAEARNYLADRRPK